MDCLELDDANELARRTEAWRAASDANSGLHPDVTPVSSRVLTRMRTSARPALRGAGMETGCSPDRAAAGETPVTSRQAFPTAKQAVSFTTIVRSIAAFERTIICG